MKDILTKRQEEVLTFIKKYSAEHGYPPAIREICDGVGLSSPATVFVHVKNLENKGYLKTENNKFRAIELLVDNEYIEKNDDVIKVPLLGKITAPEFCNAHYCELYFSPLYKRVLLCQEIFIFVLYNLVQ